MFNLSSSGAKIERRDKDNFTPLLIAASNGHSQTIKVLLDHSADISARDKHDKTAMFWAAEENQPDGLQVSLLHIIILIDLVYKTMYYTYNYI